MNNIILIGYMGCGKSSIGIKLSYKVRLGLLDTDKMIEKKEGRAISDIFDQDGEAAFRQMETDILKEIKTYKSNYVISVGGGLPIKEENQVLLKELGKVIYLRATPDTIYGRLKHDTTRPLLRGDDPYGKITSMIETRGPIYEKSATNIIDVDGKNMDEIVAEIVALTK